MRISLIRTQKTKTKNRQTMTNIATIENLQQQLDQIDEEILKFDLENDSISKLNNIQRRIRKIRTQTEDLINELEVEDFLENGPGITQ